jgi:hypothetical protein
MELALSLGVNQGGEIASKNPFFGEPFPDVYIDPNIVLGRSLTEGRIAGLANLSPSETLSAFTQIIEAQQPDFEANGINGLGSIKTDKADIDDQLISDNVGAFSKSFCLQWAFQFTALSAAATSYPLNIDFVGANFDYIPFIGHADSKIRSRFFEAADKDVIIADSALIPGGKYVFTVIYDTTNPTTGHVFRINGAEQTGSPTTTSVTGTPTGLDFEYGNLGGAFAMSALYGIFSYQQEIPPLQIILERESYLLNKYAI